MFQISQDNNKYPPFPIKEQGHYQTELCYARIKRNSYTVRKHKYKPIYYQHKRKVE